MEARNCSIANYDR